MKKLPLFLAALAIGGTALAQSTPAPTGHPDRAEMAAKFAERFKAADTNGDGALTREEAQTGMPRLAKHFDEIDSGKTGRITQDQVRAFMADRAAKHGSKKASAAAGPAG